MHARRIVELRDGQGQADSQSVATLTERNERQGRIIQAHEQRISELTAEREALRSELSSIKGYAAILERQVAATGQSPALSDPLADILPAAEEWPDNALAVMWSPGGLRCWVIWDNSRVRWWGIEWDSHRDPLPPGTDPRTTLRLRPAGV